MVHHKFVFVAENHRNVTKLGLFVKIKKRAISGTQNKGTFKNGQTIKSKQKVHNALR